MTFLRPVDRRLRYGLSVAGLFLFLFCFCTGCGAKRKTTLSEENVIRETGESTVESVTWSELAPEGEIPVEDATLFQIDTYSQGYRLMTLGEEREQQEQYLVVPEDAPIPTEVPENVTVLRQPLDQIYLVSTSVMDLVCALDGLENVQFTGTETNGWYVEEAKAALEDGSLVYAGKYSAPDYELLLSGGCDLAIENTMIFHSPEVTEQLQKLGIPTLVEYSSYEKSPLGRLEWLKLYGTLLGKEEQAAAYFEKQKELALSACQESTGKSVAFFYLTANGGVNVRKSNDYIATMIQWAGGTYLPDVSVLPPDENALSTCNIQMEAFYESARDADILTYNSTIEGELATLEDLLAENPLLADFKAVKEGKVWCSRKSMFQKSTGIARILLDFQEMLGDNPGDKLTYFYRLK